MIDADPLFADAASGNYHLAAGSPCIDAGSNAAVPAGVTTDGAGNDRFVDEPDHPDCPQLPGACGTPPVVDMGAFEKQLCPADLDGSDVIDFGDLLLVLSMWGAAGSPADLDGDGIVDFGDLLILLAAWGPCP